MPDPGIIVMVQIDFGVEALNEPGSIRLKIEVGK
jgi:hypothetical protein